MYNFANCAYNLILKLPDRSIAPRRFYRDAAFSRKRMLAHMELGVDQPIAKRQRTDEPTRDDSKFRFLDLPGGQYYS